MMSVGVANRAKNFARLTGSGLKMGTPSRSE